MLADTTGCGVISATTFQNCAVATSFTGIGHIAYFLNPYSLLVWPMTKFETKALKKSHYNKISKTTEIEVAPKVVEILLKVGKQKRCILAKEHFSAISDFYRGPSTGIKWLQVTHSWLGAKIKKVLQLVGSKSFGGWKTIGRNPKTLKQNQIILKLLGWDGRSPVRKQKNLSSGQTLKSMKIKTDLVFERRERKKAIEFHNAYNWMRIIASNIKGRQVDFRAC